MMEVRWTQTKSAPQRNLQRAIEATIKSVA